jgi:release factor glutamine methyltransferase
MLTLKAALEEATAAIGRVDAHVLVAHLLGVDRSYLVAHPMRVLTETEDARIDSFVARRMLGHPVAHLVERREFYGREFIVTPDVLIPRPETELLVESALARLPASCPPATCNLPPAALDLGTGTGAIALTLACERPDVRVTATDASDAALAVARANAEALGCSARIELATGSWFEPVAGRRFDLIVANPPYVAGRDPHLCNGDLRFEPVGALTDGSADGLDSIRAIVAAAPEHLEPGGWLIVEHGYDQREAVAGLLEAGAFADRFTADDLAGLPRVAGGRITQRRNR